MEFPKVLALKISTFTFSTVLFIWVQFLFWNSSNYDKTFTNRSSINKLFNGIVKDQEKWDSLVHLSMVFRCFFYNSVLLNPLPDHKDLDWSKLK